MNEVDVERAYRRLHVSAKMVAKWISHRQTRVKEGNRDSVGVLSFPINVSASRMFNLLEYSF